MEEKTSFLEFWKILLYSGRDIRWKEAHDLYDDYIKDIKTDIHKIGSSNHLVNPSLDQALNEGMGVYRP